MTDIKCSYYSQVCETTRGITKYISIYKIWQKKACCTIPYNTLYNTNHFSALSEIEVMWESIEEGDYESPHLNNLNKRYSVDNNEDIKMPDIKHIIFTNDSSINKRTTFTQLRSSI